jgi:ureidoglycolate lyase
MKKEIVELTAESFAPFGRVLEAHGEITKQGENWQCGSPVDFMMPGVPMMGVGIVACQAFPAAVDSLERHVSREELLWATTEDLVMAVDLPIHLGAACARPDARTTTVFRIRAGQALILARGAWHSPAFAVKGESRYFFAVEFKPDFIDQDAQPWIRFANDETIDIA